MAGIKGKVFGSKGLDALEKLSVRAKSMNQTVVDVGILGAGAAADHGGRPNVDIATFFEFGTATIPARSFVRATVDENNEEIHNTQRRLGEALLYGRTTEEKGFNLLGLQVDGMMKAKIRSNIPPPLKQKTIDRKGSSVAGIDTGQMVQSITHRVVIGTQGIGSRVHEEHGL